MTLIDTHCHLEMDEFNNDREEVIRRAREAGLGAYNYWIRSDGNTGGLSFQKNMNLSMQRSDSIRME